MFKQSTIVLSSGRSGSMLVFQNLARTHYNLENTAKILRWQTDLTEWQQQRQIFHSHAHFDLNQLGSVRPIFSVRRDIKETLISHYISNANQHWHRAPGDQQQQRNKITIDVDQLQTLVDQHLSWYRWYSKYLNSDSAVVIYEMLVDYLNQATIGYQAIYPNKHLLISNWNETQDYLEQSVTAEFRQLHGNFIDYAARPSRGIYQWASGH